jgi:SAM-dependent methyltransferase
VESEDVTEQREQMLDGWDEAAKGWGRQADRVQEAAQPISDWMIAHARLEAGDRVLELAAGPGDTGFMAARAIGPSGTLICSDAAAGMLEVARERAEEQGITNVEFKQLQLEWVDLPTASVDVVLCRWGVMLTVDPSAALRECRRVLKPGGRLSMAVWDLPEKNPWTIIMQRTLVELGHVEPPAAGGPGMFALAAPGLLHGMLEDAGFFDIEIEAVAILRRYSNVLDWIGESRDLMRQFSGIWGELSDEQRQQLRDALASAGSEFTAADGTIAVPGSSLAAVALA